MGVKNEGVFPQIPDIAEVVCTTGDASYTGGPAANPSNLQTLFTAPDEGALVVSAVCAPLGISALTVCSLAVKKSGATYSRLRVSKEVAAQGSIGVTKAPVFTDFGFEKATPLWLAGGEELSANISVSLAAGWVFVVEYIKLTAAAT